MSTNENNNHNTNENSTIVASPPPAAAALNNDDADLSADSAAIATTATNLESPAAAQSPDKEGNKKTPVKRTPSKRLSFIERAQKESEELVRTMGGTLELEGGRRTRSSARGSSSTPTAATPPPAKKVRNASETTPRGRGRGRKLETTSPVEEEEKKSAVENKTKAESTPQRGKRKKSVNEEPESNDEEVEDEKAKTKSTENATDEVDTASEKEIKEMKEEEVVATNHVDHEPEKKNVAEKESNDDDKRAVEPMDTDEPATEEQKQTIVENNETASDKAKENDVAEKVVEAVAVPNDVTEKAEEKEVAPPAAAVVPAKNEAVSSTISNESPLKNNLKDLVSTDAEKPKNGAAVEVESEESTINNFAADESSKKVLAQKPSEIYEQKTIPTTDTVPTTELDANSVGGGARIELSN